MRILVQELQVFYRQVDERKELINDYVVKERKATDHMQSNRQEKIQ